MPLRKIIDAHDAHRCLTAWSRSGESRAGWARRHGIDPRSLNIWRVNLERSRRPAPAASPRMVELVAAPAAQAPGRYRVLCGPVVVELDEHFDEAVLRRLLAVARSC